MENIASTKIIKCPNCESMLNLNLISFEEGKNQYVWTCSKSSCDFALNTKIKENRFVDFIDPYSGTIDWQKENEEKYHEEICNGLNAKMLLFLEHFIDCDWPGHYHSIYNDVIVNCLNDSNILDFVLHSGVIQPKGNTITSKNGANIFYDLFLYLMKVKSNVIKDYLRDQFPEYFTKYCDNQ